MIGTLGSLAIKGAVATNAEGLATFHTRGLSGTPRTGACP